MCRTILVLGFLLAALVPASAEEFMLKDGTKIQGRMVAVKGDKIEVETAYGKMQIRRSDILTINFPENGGTAVSQSSGDAGKARPVDESPRLSLASGRSRWVQSSSTHSESTSGLRGQTIPDWSSATPPGNHTMQGTWLAAF